MPTPKKALAPLKLCPRDGFMKPLDQFAKHARNPDGLQIYCRECQSDMRQAWKANNKQRVLDNDRNRRAKKKLDAAAAAAPAPGVDDASAQIYPDISETDRAVGRVALGKLTPIANDDGSALGHPSLHAIPLDPLSASPTPGEGGQDKTKKNETDPASTTSTHASEDAAAAAKDNRAAFGGERDIHERRDASQTATPTVASTMNTTGFADLPHAAIVQSKTNPRTHFDQAFIKDLAADIARNGLMQAILVRPLPASRVEETSWVEVRPTDTYPFTPRRREIRPTHEIVAGEQRWRACGIAGLRSIPCMVRDLTDDQVLEFQLVENLKRRDLHAMEEAEGYERMIERGHTADEIAVLIDKGRTYVYETLSLMRLVPDVRKAFYEGRIVRTVAELIAKHTAELQPAILKDVAAVDHLGDGMSFRKAREHIRNTYMLQLTAAPFNADDAQLVPTAGTCQACPKRSGANPDLFGALESSDTCTDPPCFALKKAAHYKAIEKAAEARGQSVITGRQAREIMPDSRTLRGYTRVDEPQDVGGGEMKSLRGILGEDLPPTTLIEDPSTHAMIEALPTVEAGKLLRDRNAPKAPTTTPAPAPQPEESEGTDKRKLSDTYELTWRTKAVRALAESGRVDALSEGALRAVAALILTHLQGAGQRFVAEVAGVGSVGQREGIAEHLRTVRADALPQWILVLMAAQNLQRLDAPAAFVEAAAAELRVDLKPIQAKVKKDMKAEAAAKAPAAPAASPTPSATKPTRKGKTPAPTLDEFNAQLVDKMRDAGNLNAFKPDERVRIKGNTLYRNCTYNTLGMQATIVEPAGDRAWVVQADDLNFPLTLDYTEIEPC